MKKSYHQLSDSLGVRYSCGFIEFYDIAHLSRHPRFTLNNSEMDRLIAWHNATLTIHELKTWPVHFDAMWERLKAFEVRKNDRNFCTGDTLRLREYDPMENHYSGREIHALIGYMLVPLGLQLLHQDVVAMQLEEMQNIDGDS